MSTKIKKVYITISALFLFAASLFIGVLLSGNLGNVIGAFSNSKETVAETFTDHSVESTSIKSKTEQPEKVRGIWLTAGIDYLVDNSDSAEAKNNEIDNITAEIKKMGFNTVFLDYTSEAESSMYLSLGNYNELEYLISTARKNGLFIVSNLSVSDFINSSDKTEVDDKKLCDYCKKYNSDALMISGFETLNSNISEKLESDGLIPMIKNIAQDVLKSDEYLLFGVQIEPDNIMQNIANELFADSSVDFIYLEPEASHNDDDSYVDIIERWNKSLINSGGKCILGQKADLLFKSDSWSDPNEIIIQSTQAEKLESCCGTAFRSYHIIKNNEKGIGTAYCEYLKNVNNNIKEREFEITNQKGREITTNESKISFTGGCNPLYTLTCNSKNIKFTKAGDFSVEYELKAGKNTFVFQQNGKSYKYDVIYKIDLLKSVSPKGELTAPGGTEIEISAIALRKAKVYAVVNGKKVTMTSGNYVDYDEDQQTLDSDSDYVTYYGKYTFPKGKTTEQNLGRIMVYSQYNGLNKSISGAMAIVSSNFQPTTAQQTTKASTTSSNTTKESTTFNHTTTKLDSSAFITTRESSENTTNIINTTLTSTTLFPSTNPVTTTLIPVTTAPVQGKQLTPYNYAGVSGISRMCEINIDNCETMPISPLNDYSYPLTTPLLKGMFDYITGESSYDDCLYYNLASGKRVYRKDVKVIEKGYNLPSNKINVISSNTANDTVINLSMTWKVPVNTEIKGQNYAKIYNSREFGVWDFTGNCIEIKFYHTSSATGKIDVTGSNVIKNAEWVTDISNNYALLRLNFNSNGVYYGYSISYNSDGSLKISIKNKPANELAGYTIMLDAGHGGNDSGAVCSSTSPSNMKYEKQINLAIAKKIQQRLLLNGAIVLMTRDDDSNPLLDSRRNSVYSNRPDLFLSIHCDSVVSSTSIGTTAYYYYAQSFPLADAIHKQLVTCYKEDIYAGDSSLINKVDRHSVFFPFKVTRVETCPSVLLEYGFVSNLNECVQLQKDVNQDKLATATVQGIIDYINLN